MVLSEEEMLQKIIKIRDEVLEKDPDDENGDRSIKMKGGKIYINTSFFQFVKI